MCQTWKTPKAKVRVYDRSSEDSAVIGITVLHGEVATLLSLSVIGVTDTTMRVHDYCGFRRTRWTTLCPLRLGVSTLTCLASRAPESFYSGCATRLRTPRQQSSPRPGRSNPIADRRSFLSQFRNRKSPIRASASLGFHPEMPLPKQKVYIRTSQMQALRPASLNFAWTKWHSDVENALPKVSFQGALLAAMIVASAGGIRSWSIPRVTRPSVR